MKKKSVSTKIPQDIWYKFRIIQFKKGITVTKVIEDLIMDFVDKNKRLL